MAPRTAPLLLLAVAAVAVCARADAPTRHSADELRQIRANFCNLHDSRGRVIFTPYITGLPDAERAEWYRRLVTAGSTHVVLTPGDPGGGQYPGSPITQPKLLDDPPAFRRFVDEALATRGADGKALTPIIIIDEGGRDPRTRIDRYWPAFIRSLQDVLDDVIVVPGWELIGASHWAPGDIAYALQQLHALGVRHLWVHLGPERWGMAEPGANGPWNGSDAASWTSHGGEHVEGFLYQSRALSDADDINCDAQNAACWRHRLAYGLERMGKGKQGWRQMPIAYFEGAAYYYYRGKLSDEHVRDVADAARDTAAHAGVPLGFGNGLPR
jgi:hypothetical protein